MVTRAFIRSLVIPQCVPLLHYLDDYLAAGALSFRECPDTLISTLSSTSSLLIPLTVVQVEGLSTVLSLLDIEPDTLLLVTHPSRLRSFLHTTRFPPVLALLMRMLPSRNGVSSHSTNVVYIQRLLLTWPFNRSALLYGTLSVRSFTSATTLGLIYSGGHSSTGIGSFSAFLSLLDA